MRNIKLILMILFILIACSGCSNSKKSAYKIANVIAKGINQEKPDTSKLNKNELRIYNEFRESQKKDNYVINLSKLNYYDVYHDIKLDNDSDVYLEDGDYKIKYNDIIWYPKEDMPYFTPKLGNNRVEVSKNLVPLYYEETKNVYHFVYDYYKETSDGIEFYYHSIEELGGLVIKFDFKNNKINNINLVYDITYKYESKSIDVRPKLLLFSCIVIISFIIAIFIFMFVFYNADKIIKE